MTKSEIIAPKKDENRWVTLNKLINGAFAFGTLYLLFQVILKMPSQIGYCVMIAVVFCYWHLLWALATGTILGRFTKLFCLWIALVIIAISSDHEFFTSPVSRADWLAVGLTFFVKALAILDAIYCIRQVKRSMPHSIATRSRRIAFAPSSQGPMPGIASTSEKAIAPAPPALPAADGTATQDETATIDFEQIKRDRNYS